MMGGKRDMTTREKAERQDDAAHRETIEAARGLIHNYNHAVNSEGVDRLTFNLSLVPTRVSPTSSVQ
jgi:hypothetical protein